MPKLVSEEYSELMHYTTAGGLQGIVSSDCLWATHAAFLNDAEEMTHFFDARLKDIATTELHKYVEELARVPENAKKMEADGGIQKIVRDEADRLTSQLRSATLSFNQPHIFSMSATLDARVQQSGLLSQWRGYGSDGGYAIVFDSKGFEQLLKQEGEGHHYQHGHMGNVFYYGLGPITQPSSLDIAEFEKIVQSGLGKLILGGTAEETNGFYQAITNLSCLYKHWGFQEEHEVRVIAVPVDAGVAKLGEAEGESKPRKIVKAFLRGGLSVPYIELFTRQEPQQTRMRLPIKRIVVGPHRDGASRRKAVEHLLTSNGYEATVTCSEIPYLGR